MATYYCAGCGHEDHYGAFKAHMTDEERDEEIDAQDAAYANDEDGDPDSVQCPECGSSSCVEL